MRQENFSYRVAEACYFEVTRIIKGSSSEWSVSKEGNALIDPERTADNYELVPHHEALNPANIGKEERGKAIAAYHKAVTGRSARMNGQEKQLSKAVGLIVSLPRTYLTIDYGLTEKEYAAIAHRVEHEGKEEPDSFYYKSAMKKIRDYRYSEEEKKKIGEFFEAAFESWLIVAGIRRQDVLYAVVHMDESFPHLHVMALPTCIKENGEITFSADKYNYRRTHYYDTLHTNMIREMARRGIDASGLLNGATKGKGFLPAEHTREQREKGVRQAHEISILKQHKEEVLQATESAEVDMMIQQNACQVMSESMEYMEAQTLELKNNRTKLLAEKETLVDEIEAKKTELVMMDGEIAMGQKQLLEIEKKRSETMRITEKEMKKYRKELQRTQKAGDKPNITLYQYERIMNSLMLSEEIDRKREELEEDRRNFERLVAERAREMLPEELKQAKKDKEFCDYWLTRAERLEVYEVELVKAAETIEARENEVMRREQALEEALEERAYTLFREMKEKFFKTVAQALVKLKDAIAKVLGCFLGFEIQERVNGAINQEIDQFVDNLDSMCREKTDGIEGIMPEERDIVDEE